MSRYDYRDPGQDSDYCDGLGRVTPHLPDVVICAYCDQEMARPPLLSSHPMCPTCRDKHLHGASQKAGAA